MKKIFFVQITIITALILSGCSDGKRIEEDKFIRVYSDLVIALDTTDINGDSTSVKKEIFRRYEVTDQDYANTINYYNQEPERWEIFFNKTIEYLEKKKKEVSGK